ncbi:MAG: 3-isopropylmalate dehydratase large subunit, partial [Candidatus Methylomirabilis sp.]|nr:3-isopropylmalate dehydratase large subunit [Deltaproteobacteria bacterium]
MGMTVTEKILAAHSGNSTVKPGDLVMAKVDFCLANDITAPISIKSLEEMKVAEPWDKDRIALIPSHFAPNKDIASANQAKKMRDYARAHEITHYYEQGETGIEHSLLPEKGLILPGMILIGADSHTCTGGAFGCFASGVGSTDLAGVMMGGEIWLKVPETMRFHFTGKLRPGVQAKDLILYVIGKIGVEGALYRAMEFTGPVVQGLSMEGRLTLTNMVVEAGGKNGVVEADQVTYDYLASRTRERGVEYHGDPDARYHSVMEIDVTDMEPQIAFPYSPDNVHPISQIKPEKVDQVFIGSCTNGRFEDLAIVADILQRTGREFHPDVRVMIIPGSQAVYLDALRQGWIELFT